MYGAVKRKFAEKRKIAQAEYQKNYVRKKEKDIAYEQLLEQQRQDSIELSYTPHPISDYAFKKANSIFILWSGIACQVPLLAYTGILYFLESVPRPFIWSECS